MFKEFLRYSVPTVIGLFLTSSIVVADGMFIGWKLGETGLAAVNLTLPLLYFLLALTTTIGVGGVTLANRSLGAREKERADYYFSFSLAAIAVLVAAAVGMLACFLPELATLLGAQGAVHAQAVAFLSALRWFYLFGMLNIAFSMFIRAEGEPQLSLLFGVIGNIVNLALDYWFILRLDWGMQGAGLASGIAALLPFLCGLGYFALRRSVYRFRRFRPSWNEFQAILLSGAAECIAQLSLAVTTALFNWVLLRRIGVDGVAAMTVIGYLLFLYSMIVTGIGVGIHPLISYHYGAKNRDAIGALRRIAGRAVALSGMLLCAAALLAPDAIVGLFASADESFLPLAASGLRYVAAAFLLSGYNFIAAVYFTAVGRPKTAALLSLWRSLLLVALFLLLLPPLVGNDGIWLTIPASEAVTFVAAYWLLRGACGDVASGLKG